MSHRRAWNGLSSADELLSVEPPVIRHYLRLLVDELPDEMVLANWQVLHWSVLEEPPSHLQGDA